MQFKQEVAEIPPNDISTNQEARDKFTMFKAEEGYEPVPGAGE